MMIEVDIDDRQVLQKMTNDYLVNITLYSNEMYRQILLKSDQSFSLNKITCFQNDISSSSQVKGF